MSNNKVKDALLGLCVGDALGVPVEFNSRGSLKNTPVTDMRGYGTYNVPPGTWSDDSSLAFCLADSLCSGYDLMNIGILFVSWRYQNLWTPHGRVFDIGITTRNAIQRIRDGIRPDLCGDIDESANGNGSLMRILPLVFYLKGKPVEERYRITKEVSSLTHGHFRSVLACFIYIEYVLQLLDGKDKWEAYLAMGESVNAFVNDRDFNPDEIWKFSRILNDDIVRFDETEIYSSGYVLHTLEASLWCVLNSNTYAETVLKAVNLGEDTDTTGAVAGGLAGLIYGAENIPENWVRALARVDDIVELSEKLNARYPL